MLFGVPAFRPILDAVSDAGRALLGMTYPLRRHEAYAPFFIVGAGRSGTTLLRRILQASPEIHIPPETFVLGRVIGAFLRRRSSSWHDLVHLVLGMYEFHPNFGLFDVSLRPLVNSLLEVPEERRSLAYMLDSFYRYHGTETGVHFHRWGDKSPINTFCVDEIRTVFPDARYVHLCRDGVDVVASMMAAKTTPLLGTLDGAAARWRSSIRAARRFARRHQAVCLQIRYEDLVTTPEKVVKQVCNFLGFRYVPAMVRGIDHADRMKDLQHWPHLANVLRPVFTDSIGKGRRTLTTGQKVALAGMIDAELELLGYDPVL